ncbi:hypothetical protein KsCSTR_15600 [Candidatus Kuenenia stuttgartiensis]|uniref:Uncharacterized protein n=1 Tax=Kuenenia stuttgartiensis TaxID=174633 RepID=Q1Q1M7_KUEST|nr:hypothetical protein KsCSTR_15600 [Candidatus Kuenenia stuttgartiensis]CAJ73917.1 unknown protein [Candidatus Kuenenia stuttgartiensis]
MRILYANIYDNYSLTNAILYRTPHTFQTGGIVTMIATHIPDRSRDLHYSLYL